MSAWLARLDESRLQRVLLCRPDAAVPPEPRSLGEVADRLQRPASVAQAVRRLPLPCLQAAEALAALGEGTERAALTELLGVDGQQAEALDEALTSLAEHALVWPDEAGTLHIASALREIWRTPLGLDRPLAELLNGLSSDDVRQMLVKLRIKPPTVKKDRIAALLEHYGAPDRIMAVVARAPARTREVLEEFASHDPATRAAESPVLPIMFGRPPAVAHDPAQWAAERGLLVRDRHGFRSARMSAEVTRAMRGADWRPPFDTAPPVPELTPATAQAVTREAASAGAEMVTRAASVLHECALRPLSLLKSGGVGVRELGRVGKATGSAEALVRLVLECAAVAGLLAPEGDRVLVTRAYDAWTEREPAEQLTDLLRAWWNLPTTPTDSRDEEDKPLPALAGRHQGQARVEGRRGLLAALEALPDGHGVTCPDDLGPLIGWHRPLADSHPHQARTTAPFAALVREATLLAVLALGAATPLGVALRDIDGDALLTQARGLLTPAAASARFGSDLTAVVLGTPSGRLLTLLDAVADREARGTASLWRFSGASIRRALDAGQRPEQIEADLGALTDRPLPQPLTYLIADAARRHGHLRVASVLCVLHGQDPALLAEIAAHRRLSRLGLRHLAPTVLTATAAPNDVLAALRAEGYAPVAESATGELRLERPPTQRASRSATVPRTRRAPTDAPATEPALRALATRLLTSPPAPPAADTRTTPPPDDTATLTLLTDTAPQLSATDRRQLAYAIDQDAPITIGYIAATGAATVRTVSELDLDPPYLYAWCHLRDDDRVFSLTRIQAVLPD